MMVMLQQVDAAASEPENTPPEPIRILSPSPLGVIGIEIIGRAVTRLTIIPKGRDRKLFQPLGELKRNERSEVLDEVLGHLSEYLAGARRSLGIHYELSLSEASGFNRGVLEATAKIPYGCTKNYQQIASATSNPAAYRQVLAVLVANPLPIVIPCHRVVPSKSGVGSYIAGVKRKEWLLRLEQKFQTGK